MTLLPLIALASAASGRTLYLSPTGDDAADGRSRAHAWKTLARVGKDELQPGDRLLLLDGGTFEGHLEVNGGDAKRPIVIRSEGARATIASKDAPAITVRASGVEVRDLLLDGGATAETKNNDGILLAPSKERAYRGIRIDDVEITRMGGPGISSTAEKGNVYGFDDVRITRANIHGVYGVGIITNDTVSFDSGNTRHAHHDWTVRDCDTSENFDGAGIIFGGMERALVEYSRSANNKNPDGGGLGMWAWCSKGVTFRYDIGSGIRSKGDGGGFDLDGGTVDCVVEKCLTFDNVGPGVMHCDFPFAPRTQRNIVRDNVSVDDGHSEGGGPGGFGYVVWGSGLYDCRVERNLAVITNSIAKDGDSSGIFLTFIRDDKEAVRAQRLEGAVVRDNTVVVSGKGAMFVRDNFPARILDTPVTKGVTYRGNSFYGDSSFVTGLDGKTVHDLAAWRALTGDTDGRHGAPGANVSLALGDLASVRPHDLPALFRRLGR